MARTKTPKPTVRPLAEILDALATIGGCSNRDDDVAIRHAIREGRTLPELDAIAAALEVLPAGTTEGLLLTRLAQDDSAAIRAASKADAPIPAAPFLDALKRRNTEMTSTKAETTRSGGGGTRAPKAATVQFTHDGQSVAPSQNKLSSVAWFYTQGLGKGGGRMKVGELKALLASKNIDPFKPGWSLKLDNGITIGGVKIGEKAEPVMATPKPVASEKPATAKKSTPAKRTTTKKPAPKKSTGKRGAASIALSKPPAPDKRARKETAKKSAA